MRKTFLLLATWALGVAAFAAQQPVIVGTTANDGTGDPLRTAFTKLNANDTELYAKFPVSVPNGGTGVISMAGGLIRGNVTAALGPAVISDVINLFTGTCTISVPLRGNGTCGTIPVASVTGLAQSATIDTTIGNNILTGTVSAARLGAINLALAGGGGGVSGLLPVANGGTGLGTLPAHGVLLGEGTANLANVAAMAVDTLLQGQGATVDPAAVALVNCGSSTQALAYSTSTHAFSCQTLAPGGGATTGTFTATVSTGCTTTPTATMGYTIVGNMATVGLLAAGLSCTSNTQSMTIGGLPPALIPVSVGHKVPCSGITDNGNSINGACEIDSGTTFIFVRPYIVTGTQILDSNTGFTASGTKGLSLAFAITYPIN